jgi:hypothetical protein
MLKRTVLSLPLLALTMAPWPGFAQNQSAPQTVESQKFYKLEFVVKEVEGGKVLNARAYSTTAVAESKDFGSASIRASSRIPLQNATSVQYLDVGVSIDCRNIKEVERGLSLFVTADISSVPSDPAAPAVAPTVRQNRWSSLAIVPLKKPTLIFSSDDPTSKRQMQMELTATPIT